MAVGGFVGGAIAGIFDLKGYAMTSANFLSLLCYVGGTNANIAVGVVASFSSLIVAAVLTYLFGFSKKDLESV